MYIDPKVMKAGNELRRAIEASDPDTTIAIMAPEPIGTAFRAYVEAIRIAKIEHTKLQTHWDDEIKRLEEEAKP